jgi:O-antigen/teichoic acid export membrane protein
MVVPRVKSGLAYLTGEGLGPFLVRAIAGSGAVRIAAMAAGFLVGVQLARTLGVEGYGYYGLALSIVTIAAIPGELGIPRLVTREVSGAAATHDYGRLYGILGWARRTVVKLSAIMAALVVAASVVLAETHRPLLALAILAGAPVIPFMAFARVSGGALQGLNHVVRGQIPANLLRPVLMSAMLLAGTLTGMTIAPAEAMLLNSVTAAAAVALSYVWLRQRLPARAPPRQVEGERGWLASTIPLALTDGMRILQIEMTIVLVGLFASATQVGLLRIATAVATTAAVAMPVVTQVALPTIARLHAAGQPGQLQKLVTYSARVQFAGVCLLSLPLVFAAEPLLTLVYGPAYAAAADPLRIVAVGQIANAALGPNAALLNMTHHERRVSRAMAMALVVNVTGVLWLVHQWGAIGGAVSFVAGLVCWNVLTWRDGRRLLGIETSVLGVRRS